MHWLIQVSTHRRRYDELSESIREHPDEKIADLMDRGMTHEEAERTARREFGNFTQIRSSAVKYGSGQGWKAHGQTLSVR